MSDMENSNMNWVLFVWEWKVNQSKHRIVNQEYLSSSSGSNMDSVALDKGLNLYLTVK